MRRISKSFLKIEMRILLMIVCKNCNNKLKCTTEKCPICNTPTGIKEMLSAEKGFWKIGKPSVLGKLFIVLLAIILFFVSTASVILFSARTISSTNNIEATLNSLPLDEIAGEEFENIATDLTKSFNEYKITCSKQDVMDFVNQSSIKPFVIKKVAIFINDLLNKKEGAELTLGTQTVYELLLENKPLMYSILNMPDISNEELYEITERAMGEKEYCLVHRDEIDTDFLNITKVVLSDSLFIILLAALLLIIFIMIKINLFKGINSAATSLMFMSLLGIAAYFIITSATKILLKKEVSDVEFDILSKVSNDFLTSGLIISIVLLVVCIIALVLSKKFRIKAISKRYRKY